VPFESAERRRALQSGRTASDRRSKSRPQGDHPRLEVSEAETEVDGQSPGRLPVILHEALVGTVRDVIDAVERGFIVMARDTQDLVGIGISLVKKELFRHKIQLPLVSLLRLGVADPLPEETHLDRMCAHNFGERIADAGHVLVGVETLRSAAVSNPPIEHIGRFAPEAPKDGIWQYCS